MSEEKKIKVEENILFDNAPVQKAIDVAKKAGHEDAEEKVAEIIDEEFYESPTEPQATLSPILHGLEVPKQKKGPWSKPDREKWLVVVENLMIRHVKSSNQIAKVTGLSSVAAAKFVSEIKETWQNDLTPGKVNVRREQLYGENERIAEFCWAMIQGDPNSIQVPQFLKIIGDTNTRRSRLIGADQITLAVGHIETKDIDTNAIQAQAAAKLGVSINSLREMGDLLATKMIPSIDSNDEEDEEEQDTNN